MTPYRDGNLIGPRADSEWLYVVPWGIRALIGHITTRYSGPPGGIWITENGVDVPNEASQPYPAVLADTFRTSYYQVPPVTALRTGHPELSKAVLCSHAQPGKPLRRGSTARCAARLPVHLGRCGCMP